MTIHAAVRRYVQHGFRPIPMWGVDASGRCRCGGRLPNGTECRAGKHSPDPVEADWKVTGYGPADFAEDQNVALALGPWKPGAWVVCFDYDGLPADYEGTPFFSLPPTLTQQSPRGRHLFFTVPEFEPLGNWNDVFRTKAGDGVALDIRYARGRINVAPSRSAFGTYRWTSWREPAALPPEVPGRIYDQRRAWGLEVLPTWNRGAKAPGV
jgi:hypothetical protein